jgi:hypothetical protein
VQLYSTHESSHGAVRNYAGTTLRIALKRDMRKSTRIHLKLIYMRVAAVKTQVRVQNNVSESITNSASELSSLRLDQNSPIPAPDCKWPLLRETLI